KARSGLRSGFPRRPTVLGGDRPQDGPARAPNRRSGAPRSVRRDRQAGAAETHLDRRLVAPHHPGTPARLSCGTGEGPVPPGALSLLTSPLKPEGSFQSAHVGFQDRVRAFGTRIRACKTGMNAFRSAMRAFGPGMRAFKTAT